MSSSGNRRDRVEEEGPYKVSWADAENLSVALDILARCETTLSRVPVDVEALIACWKDIVSFNSGIAGAIQSLGTRTREWKADERVFINPFGPGTPKDQRQPDNLITKTEVVTIFLFNLPGGFVPEAAATRGYLTPDEMRAKRAFWIMLRDRMIPHLPPAHRPVILLDADGNQVRATA